jgi:tRNA(Ile)-lysidine synthase
MAASRMADGVLWLRPLLGRGRAELRDYLTARGVSWAEDPTNDDTNFDRVKARKLLDLLGPLGIDAARLAGTADDMRMARGALEQQTVDAARRIATVEHGNVGLDPDGLCDLPAEIRGRLLAHALCFVSGAAYRPRRKALAGVERAAANGKASTLHGCVVFPGRGRLWITREYNAVRGLRCGAGRVWDGRWHACAPAGIATGGYEIRALGEAGIAMCPGGRDTGVMRKTLPGSPSVWKGDTLVSAPMAGFSGGWTIKPLNGAKQFVTSILSH